MESSHQNKAAAAAGHTDQQIQIYAVIIGTKSKLLFENKLLLSVLKPI